MFRPTYIKNRQRQKWRRLVGVSILIVSLVGLSWLGTNYLRQQHLAVTYPVCDWKQKQIVKYFSEEPTNKLGLTDYFFYGETLNLTQAPYSIFSIDPLIGKTAILKNVCVANQDHVFIFENKVDRQLALENLADGFYEVYFQDNLINKRAYFDEVVYDQFFTTRRNGEVKKIELIANRELFDDRKNTVIMQENYLFLKVTTQAPIAEYYDIILNPAYLDRDNGYSVDYGSQVGNLIEAQENYLNALALKEALESYGLKVLLTRDEAEIINTYGEAGRLARGYAAQAKYLIDLRLNYSSYGNSGFEVVYGSSSSLRLASYLSENLASELKLTSPQQGRYPGIRTLNKVSGYEGNLVIRESGGKALAAASYSSKSAENASFALNNRFGMQAISLRYAYLNDQVGMEKLINQREHYAQVAAKAIADYLQLRGAE